MGLYLVPAAGTGTKSDPRRPAYIPAFGVPWVGQPFGVGDLFVVRADLTATQELSLALHLDAFTVPPLDSLLTAVQATALVTRLEARGLPAQWVIAGDRWSRALRTILILCHFADKIGAALPSLDTTLGAMTAGQSTSLSAAAGMVGLDPDAIFDAATPFRHALYQLALAWWRPVRMGDVLL